MRAPLYIIYKRKAEHVLGFLSIPKKGPPTYTQWSEWINVVSEIPKRLVPKLHCENVSYQYYLVYKVLYLAMGKLNMQINMQILGSVNVHLNFSSTCSRNPFSKSQKIRQFRLSHIFPSSFVKGQTIVDLVQIKKGFAT